MNNTHLHIADESFSLKRFPLNQFDKSLRAWDAGDEYLISHVVENIDLASTKHIVIVNDSFGALTCAMARLAPHARIDVYTDSFMSETGILKNLVACNLDKNSVNIHSALELAQLESANTHIDLMLVKVPRTLSYLEFLLIELNKLLNDSTQIIAAAMVKLITSSALKVFDKCLSNTRTSLARKKARLVFADKRDAITESLPVNIVSDAELNFDLHNYANVFCRDQVDIGARYMLKAMPKHINPNQVVIDLGCGNGILGTQVLLNQAQAKVIFVDESYMAIASAKETLANSGALESSGTNNAEFVISHCLHDFPDNSADVVLCNPPFHQQNTVIDDIAWQMFVDAKRVLKEGGELRIVGNRHLDHRVKLTKLFGGCKVVASDTKFLVLKAIKHS
ncbi:methyltransferase [Glaciecola sp. 2405UD65-10]|uniref:methyltransferase n=1 Tax=Glaciecola sp. 2405UD65-10 TaxID=3397244 RepID=UPI003B5ADEC0